MSRRRSNRYATDAKGRLLLRYEDAPFSHLDLLVRCPTIIRFDGEVGDWLKVTDVVQMLRDDLGLYDGDARKLRELCIARLEWTLANVSADGGEIQVPEHLVSR